MRVRCGGAGPPLSNKERTAMVTRDGEGKRSRGKSGGAGAPERGGGKKRRKKPAPAKTAPVAAAPAKGAGVAASPRKSPAQSDAPAKSAPAAHDTPSRSAPASAPKRWGAGAAPRKPLQILRDKPTSRSFWVFCDDGSVWVTRYKKGTLRWEEAGPPLPGSPEDRRGELPAS
jgi:hypothetical protein